MLVGNWRRKASCSLAIGALVSGLVLVTTPAYAYDDPGEVDGMVLDGHGAAIVNDVDHTELAPGLEHVSFERLTAAGWLQVNVLRAQLSPTTVRAGYLGPDSVAGRGTVSQFTDSARALAGINGDFFDINNSFAPVGPAISEEKGLLKSGDPGRNTAVGFDGNGLGRIAQIYLQGRITTPAGGHPIAGLNLSRADAGQVVVYNANWGDYSRARVLAPGETGVEVLVDADGRVTSVSAEPGEGRLTDGVQAIVARPGADADALSRLAIGDEVEVSYGLNPEAEDLAIAVGGQPDSEVPLLRDGAVTTDTSEYNVVLNPRTAVGFDESGDTAYFVVVDGRRATSIGMSLKDLGDLMKDLGADDALNLDGGGSSQLNTREPGDPRTTVQNSPSDGYERTDANGLGLFLSQAGSGVLTGYDVAPAIDDEDATRVFPGLHRTLVAKGHDETLSSVDVPAAAWASDAETVATVDAGVVTGVAPGDASIVAGADVTGTAGIRVLGELARLTTSQTVLNLEGEGASATVSVTGSDAEGFTAPIEGADVVVDNPRSDVFEVAANDDGTVSVTAIGSEGTAVIGLSAGGVRAEIAVAVPLELKVVDDFSDVTGWTSAHDRAPGGSVVVAEGHDGSNGLHMAYDFTQSTATRGQYAVAPGGGIEVPGKPQKLSVWVKGDGNGALLRLQVLQGDGVRSWLDGADGSTFATFTGWQRIDFAVPSSFEFPLKLERIRALETTAVKQYRGELTFSKIYAYLPPEGTVAPIVEPAHDASVVAAGATAASPLRVAVMSDAQFVARDPESPAVHGARDVLREIVAARPDLLVINGDFVDEGSVEDFELARRILDEELGDSGIDYHYVPGNHEIMGASIENFTDAFGPATSTFDVDGTRFVTLNSATGKLNSDHQQVRELQRQLLDAADDPAISGVVVFAHHPVDDPLPTKASQLTDRHEADMVGDWLERFRAESGKSVAYVGSHVGVFHTTRIDGVPYVINGNAGKDPASTPTNGGFTGWTMLGIDPSAGVREPPSAAAAAPERWLSVETQPRVDALTLSAPERLKVGESASLTGTIDQDGERSFPIAWPMSHAWSGDGLFVGDPAQADASAVAAIDPVTNTVTALRAGTVQLTLAVSDATRTATLVVEPTDDPGTGNPDDPGTGNPGDGSEDPGAGTGTPGTGSAPGDGSGSGDANTDADADGDLAATGSTLSVALLVIAALAIGGGIVLQRRRAGRLTADDAAE